MVEKEARRKRPLSILENKVKETLTESFPPLHKVERRV